jgi:hypothetical protein
VIGPNLAQELVLAFLQAQFERRATAGGSKR